MIDTNKEEKNPVPSHRDSKENIFINTIYSCYRTFERKMEITIPWFRRSFDNLSSKCHVTID